jgi:hypothetical protein
MLVPEKPTQKPTPQKPTGPAARPEDQLPTRDDPGRVPANVRAGAGLKRFKLFVEPFEEGDEAEYWVAKDMEEACRLMAEGREVDPGAVVGNELPY